MFSYVGWKASSAWFLAFRGARLEVCDDDGDGHDHDDGSPERAEQLPVPPNVFARFHVRRHTGVSNRVECPSWEFSLLRSVRGSNRRAQMLINRGMGSYVEKSSLGRVHGGSSVVAVVASSVFWF